MGDEEIEALLVSDEPAERSQGVTLAYRKYHGMIKEKVLRYGTKQLSGSDGSAITNSVFIALWENVTTGQFQRKGKLKSYLTTIAYNQCKKFLRDRRRHPESFTDDFSHIDHAHHPLDLLADMEQSFWETQNKDLQTLKKCLDILSPQDRRIYEDFYLKQKKVREIAEEHQKKENWVKQRLFVMRKQLRRCKDQADG